MPLDVTGAGAPARACFDCRGDPKDQPSMAADTGLGCCGGCGCGNCSNQIETGMAGCLATLALNVRSKLIISVSTP